MPILPYYYPEPVELPRPPFFWPCCGACGKKTRLSFTIIAFLALAATNAYSLYLAWQLRSDPDEVERYGGYGFSYTYITNVMATITAMVILSSILSVAEICIFPQTGFWMVGMTLTLVILHFCWVVFWDVECNGPLLIGATFAVSVLFLLGGYLFEFIRGFVITAAVSYAFIGSIVLSCLIVPGNWRVVADSNGATSRISAAIACLFFSGIAAVAALLIGYLPYRFNKCRIPEVCIVILIGLTSFALAGGAGGALLTVYRNQLAQNSKAECNDYQPYYEWCTGWECCTSTSGARFGKLRRAVWGFIFGSFALAAVALFLVLRAATAQFVCPPDAADYLQVEVYDDGELVKTVRTYKTAYTPWDVAVQAGEIVDKE